MKRTLAFLVVLAAITFAGWAANQISIGVNSSYTGGNGITVSVSKQNTSLVANTNVSVISFTAIGTTDIVIQAAGTISDSYITIIDDDPTNAANILKFSSGSTTYSGYVRPQEAAAFRIVGGDGFLHVTTTDTTHTVTGTLFVPPSH